MKALVVEDNSFQIGSLIYDLEKRNVDVDLAEDAEDA
jgi:DNA-binding response OmpR family regulator